MSQRHARHITRERCASPAPFARALRHRGGRGLANQGEGGRRREGVQHHPLLWTGLGRLPRLTSDSQDPLWDRFYSSPWFLSVFLHHDVKESEEIFEILTAELSRRRGVDAIVAFGHRHERSLSEIGPVILEEAPNLAAKAEDFGFYLVGATGNSLDVSWCGERQ
jgi:hypothetical protein